MQLETITVQSQSWASTDFLEYGYQREHKENERSNSITPKYVASTVSR